MPPPEQNIQTMDDEALMQQYEEATANHQLFEFGLKLGEEKVNYICGLIKKRTEEIKKRTEEIKKRTEEIKKRTEEIKKKLEEIAKNASKFLDNFQGLILNENNETLLFSFINSMKRFDLNNVYLLFTSFSFSIHRNNCC